MKFSISAILDEKERRQSFKDHQKLRREQRLAEKEEERKFPPGNEAVTTIDDEIEKV